MDMKKAEEIPSKMPFKYFNSVLVINQTPKTTIAPNSISYQIILLLKNRGSINEVKKAPVENIANAIDMLDCSIDSKKVIQCKAIIVPAIKNLKMVLKSTTKLMRLNLKQISIIIAAINILNQTIGIEPIVINSPKIAVNPAIKTRKCKCK